MEAKLNISFKKKTAEGLSSCAQGIIKTLLYFDIFSYPLTAREIFMNHPQVQLNPEEFNESLVYLLEHGLIFQIDGFYSIENNIALAARRRKGNVKAEHYLKYARFISRFLSQLPFIRQISLSGSLSKGYMDKTSDIDYFIITSPGRLWLARTIIVLLKTIFFLNSHKFLCINYFIDEQHLDIHERNIFTAREIAYLLPVYNSEKFKDFNTANNWNRFFLPNFEQEKGKVLEKDFLIKGVMEKLLSGKSGDWLDDFCMKLTLRFWKRKHPGIRFNDSIRCSKWEAKYHPRYYQGKTLEKYKNKIMAFEKSRDITLV